MMTVASVASAGDAASYYSSKDNYYFLDDMPTQWLGEGALELGLEGPVDLDTFTAILHGNLPNGVELGKDVQGKHVHRPGHDLTFSAPKSVSMLILAGGDKRLLEAHHEAVKETLAIIEQTISARDTKEGVTSIIPTGKMVAALFTHDTTRNLDPGIHTHAVVANATELDGKWKALATDYIYGAGFIETVYRHQVTFGKIYRNRLKQRAESLGYETELTGGKHELWEIKGFPEEVLEEFSSRHREISARAGEEASLKSRDVAALDTRQRKQDISRYGESDGEPRAEKSQSTMASTSLRSDPLASPGNIPRGGLDKGGEVPIAKPETEDGRARLKERWQRQMDDIGFDMNQVMETAKERESTLSPPEVELPATSEAKEAVREAISVLSDNKTRFTYGDLLLTAHESGAMQYEIPELKKALDEAIEENLLVPLDGDKGVFTSHIHLLDELSVQSLASEILKENTVVDFRLSGKVPAAGLKDVARSPVAILKAPASVEKLRDMTVSLVQMAREQGRDVSVMASSAERAISFSKSPALKENLLHRSRVLDSNFALEPQSTLIVESGEKLGLKEMLVLTGEARTKNVQLLFLDSAGRQANASALSVLAAAGVERLSPNQTENTLETRVISIADKRDRYQALADRYAEISGVDEPVTAAVVGAREQQQLTGIIRSALQDAGKLGQESVVIEGRTPVFMSEKERKVPGTYRPGMVLEDRTDKHETRHFVIDRIHEDTRMLSLIDNDGVLSRVKLSSLSGDWRLFNREQLDIAQGEKLFALAGDKAAGLKARDRLTVTGINEGVLTLTREGQTKPIRLEADRPLYITHGYVSAPGSRDNERGTVLASLGARDLTANMINGLAQSGHEAEIFTGEALNRAEEKLARMRTTRTPVELVRQASGREEVSEAISSLKTNLLTDAEKAVVRSVGQMRHVAFEKETLVGEAMSFSDNIAGIHQEINRQVKAGELIEVGVNGAKHYVAQATWELEKAILHEVAAGKNAVAPLMTQVDPALLNGLTRGQQNGATLILQSPDRFTLVQGYAGVGKTTQFSAVKAAIETLPEASRPIIVGLAPTHRAAKEMRSVGIDAQTVKSFVMDWQQRTAAGENVRYDNTLFLIDESSMLGNQDTAAAYRAIAAGEGRAVPVGDMAQFKSPESGAPFQLMQERSPIDVAVMKEIVRQRDSNIKSAVYSIIENDVNSALQSIEKVSPDVVPRRPGAERPSLSIVQSEEPTAQIVTDYMSRTDEARENTMIIVQLHKDRIAINTGIHDEMAKNGELGSKAVTVSILDRITGGRHDFNRIQDWEIGQTVLANEQYLDVVDVNHQDKQIILKDEGGGKHYYSPAELNATEVEVFNSREIELRTGDKVRFNKTQKHAGHAAHEEYRVEALRDNGEIVLRNGNGDKILTPRSVVADRHLDHAWAVTGYGAQGASSPYDIVLEGVEGARERMSGMRAFYINVSRAKDHVQIVTDDREKWIKTLNKRSNRPETAHDAIEPETERKQARRIWGMGQSASKTAIGRAFLQSQGLKGNPVNARIIPPTSKYPDAHLALPVFDGNGKAAGLSMSALQHDEGQFRIGEARQIITTGSQAAILQKSQNGQTVIVSDLAQALTAARDNPESGVLILTGKSQPSAQLLKVVGGDPLLALRPDETLLKLVQSELVDMLASLPADIPQKDDRAILQAAIREIDKAPQLPDIKPEDKTDSGMAKIQLSAALAARVAEVMAQQIPTLPGEPVPDYSELVRQASAALAQGNVEVDGQAVHTVLNALASSGLPAGISLPKDTAAEHGITASVAAHVLEEQQRGKEVAQRTPAGISADTLDSVTRELQRQIDLPLPERGREPERQEMTREMTRHIQKER